jgi:hypothetical protein
MGQSIYGKSSRINETTVMKLANDIAAFTNVIGLNNLGLTWQLANIPWESDEDRDQFIEILANLTTER